MAEPRDFPVLQIDGEGNELLAPYRHACRVLREQLVEPGDESALKATALRGLEQSRVDAWDAAWGTLGARWAGIGTQSLTDPFLAAFDNNGYVPARLDLTNGGNPPGDKEADRIAAPLFAMAEWELFKLRGDRDRLAHAYELLRADFLYREDHVRKRNGLLGGSTGNYHLHATGRFMLGGRVVPSLAGGASWVDASGMYALNARVLAEMARVLKRNEDAGELKWALRDVAARMNALMWSEEEGWYFDLDEHGSHLGVKTLASLWAVWSGVAPRSRTDVMLEKLGNPTQFERANPYSTVSAAEGDYRAKDGTPRGVARADFNLAAWESAFAVHRHSGAQRACEAHFRRVAKVLKDSGDLYLAYDPDRDTPAPLSDGSSGANTPLASACVIQGTLGVLMGLRPHAHREELELCPCIEERHTIEGLQFAFGTINMNVGAADKSGARREIELMCDVPFKLRVRTGEQSVVHDIKPGMHALKG